MPANNVNLKKKEHTWEKKKRANEHCSYNNPDFMRKGNTSTYVCNTQNIKLFSDGEEFVFFYPFFHFLNFLLSLCISFIIRKKNRFFLKSRLLLNLN